MEKFKCRFCGEIVEQSETKLWGHIQMEHPEEYKLIRNHGTPDMEKWCFLPTNALFERKIPLVTPAYVCEIIADFGRSGVVTQNGDRKSRYFQVAMGREEKRNHRVMVALIEEKSGISREEAGYAFHVINDVDGSDAQMFWTDHLDEEEALNLFDDILKRLENGYL